MVGGGQTHIFLTTSHLRGTYIDSWHTISMWVMICDDMYVSHDSLIPSCESDFLMRVWFPYESLIPLFESDSLMWVWFPYVSHDMWVWFPPPINFIPDESIYVTSRRLGVWVMTHILLVCHVSMYVTRSLSGWIDICDSHMSCRFSPSKSHMSWIDVCDSESEGLNRYMWLTYVMPHVCHESIHVTHISDSHMSCWFSPSDTYVMTLACHDTHMSYVMTHTSLIDR